LTVIDLTKTAEFTDYDKHREL